MTQPPLVVYPPNSLGRHYKHPETGELYPSITTVLEVLNKGFGMVQSAANNTVVAMFNRRDLLAQLASEKEALNQFKYAYRDAWEKKADLGSSVHEVIEALWRDEELPAFEEDRAPYLDAFLKFVSDFEPTWVLVECTVFSEYHGYAGTFDFIMQVDRFLILGDHKTGKAIYPETALQLAPLRFADKVWSRNTGELQPMPRIDAAIALHLKPGKYTANLVNADNVALQAFLGLLQAWPWTKTEQAGIGPAVTRKRLLRSLEATEPAQGLIQPSLEVVKP
ncbi:MAG: hypothetical protein ACRDIC_01400 [bacterium]